MRVSLTIAAALLPLVAGATPTPARAEVAGRYVALGDSFVAGPFIPHQHGDPRGCLRSDHNYPSLVADGLKAVALVDVSCSGAKTADMTASQRVPFGWRNPPQLDALTPATALVTLGIGGNDIGYIDIAISCGTMGLLNPSGAPCAKRYSRELDQRIAATGPRVTAVLQAIHQRAPRARVLVVGYPRLLPTGAGCWPSVPLGPADTIYLDGVERSLNAMLRARALAGGAEFVDAYAGSGGHDMCADSRQRWVEGVVPTSPAAPLHSNARGMRVVAARVLAVLSRPRPQQVPLSAPVLSAPAPAPLVQAPNKAVPVAGKGPLPATGTGVPGRPAQPKIRILPAPVRPMPAAKVTAPVQMTAPVKAPPLVREPVGGRGPAVAHSAKGPAPAALGKGPAVALPGRVRVIQAPGKVRVVPPPGKVRVVPPPGKVRVLPTPGR
ncbi:GDSL-type esterase/lipase family protein [Actinomadura scrupuli]|uniref:SGNH/GDSL hydrolase family protein n=1 Tax=Actinomadura scrupuli TaxID=559629 RepID=UPI003D99BB93